MRIPSDNKNQINRGRGATLDAAGSGRVAGFERKPQLDEHHKPSPGLERGPAKEDKQQGDLQNAAPPLKKVGYPSAIVLTSPRLLGTKVVEMHA
jgi:hypothetical protein